MKKYKESFIKTLTQSDVDLHKSNQHELHGVSKLESLFGKILDDQKLSISASFSIVNTPPKPIHLTWYNSRSGSGRHEYRLYYDKYINECKPGDNFFIGVTLDNLYEIIIFPDQQDKYDEWTKID